MPILPGLKGFVLGEIPKTKDPSEQKYVDWYDNWLHSRNLILKGNIISASDRGNLPQRVAYSLIGNDKKRQVSNMASADNRSFSFNNDWAWEGSLNYGREDYENSGILGSFIPDENVIEYNTDYPDTDATHIHERTHASRPWWQISKVKSIIESDKVKTNGRWKGMEYDLNPSEVYSRMNEFRYENGIDPYQKIDQKFIDKNRAKLRKYNLDLWDDTTIIKLFNLVAQNGDKTTRDLLIAKFGGSIPTILKVRK